MYHLTMGEYKARVGSRGRRIQLFKGTFIDFRCLLKSVECDFVIAHVKTTNVINHPAHVVYITEVVLSLVCEIA